MIRQHTKPAKQATVTETEAADTVCRKCGGTGEVDGHVCPQCKGTGRIAELVNPA
ncbi:hypothetical protein SAMN05428963_11523 [Consotaella salsifontis]|uniref:Molecular chaperone DnaJ n=1 Tax=Consotaella salsifontis TaxID=1365950 RepID=A0A1T4SWN1_9HYPH|nr:hypothetical protein SAMN05428963_11523 [Consotaella salsifontis]